MLHLESRLLFCPSTEGLVSRNAVTNAMETDMGGRVRESTPEGGDSPGHGIVITDGWENGTTEGKEPRILAFIWGGRVRPTPTLPYGRWKGAA